MIGKILTTAALFTAYKFYQAQKVADGLKVTFEIFKFTLTKGVPELQITCNITNPTNASLTVDSIAGEILFTGIAIGSIKYLTPISIKPKSYQSIVLVCNFNALNTLTAFINLFGKFTKELVITADIYAVGVKYQFKQTLKA